MEPELMQMAACLQRDLKRRSRKTDPDILALKHFVKALEVMTDYQRRAAIYWLANRYLGIKIW